MSKVPFIEVENLVARYGDRTILDGVSFTVNEGEIVCVIGGSGSGKTTLFKHMAGLLHPASGAIRYRDENIAEMDEDEISKLLSGIGVAFQSGGLINSMTVAENIALPIREQKDIDKELIDSVVRFKLSLVGLGGTEDMLPSELSGGMRKRASFARAIALDPPIVYFDEPSAGLDPIMAAGLDNLILKLRRLLGITLIIVTHELDSIRTIADRILMLDQGKVLFYGSLEAAETSDIERVHQFFSREADEHIVQRN